MFVGREWQAGRTEWPIRTARAAAPPAMWCTPDLSIAWFTSEQVTAQIADLLTERTTLAIPRLCHNA